MEFTCPVLLNLYLNFSGGDPEYNVPVLDPLDVKELHANGRGGVSLSFVLKQATLEGLKDIDVKQMK